MTVAQIASAGVVAVAGPLGYPAFAFLYAGSSALRVVAWRGAGAPAPVEQVRAATEAGASVAA